MVENHERPDMEKATILNQQFASVLTNWDLTGIPVIEQQPLKTEQLLKFIISTYNVDRSQTKTTALW